MLPTSTYRIQLRSGVTLDTVARDIPRLAALGLSHLHLSPIQTATPGSTHGYDIIDATEVDPILGGRPALDRLSRQAQDHGLGLILDIVPNHMAFHLSNAWLRDVLSHGPASRHAPIFDIDWTAGRLVLPLLPAPFATLLERGDIALTDSPDGPALRAGDLTVPLRPDIPPHTDLAALHDAQHWRLTHWRLDGDGITHRRFFNITGLIGLRVEDPAVFDDTHALILDLVRNRRIHGLRIDHIDGLADPAAYLVRLRAAVGNLPLWVEKILTRDEPLPDWPVQGTTGYDATRQITRLLAAPAGLARLRTDWAAQTGLTAPFATQHATAKRDILHHDLAAELLSLITLARPVRNATPRLGTGDEALREAVLALLLHFPCYRSYLSAGPPSAADLRLIRSTADAAAQTLRDDSTLRRLAQALTHAASPAETRFRTRFQQITGALAAKSLEDTLMFRHTPMLALCEVGSDPNEAPLTPQDFARWATDRGARWPLTLTLTSSHDTKRSEDARARLLAATYDPDALLSLIAQLPDTFADVPPALRWYITQSWLAIFGTPDHPARLVRHIEKAMREAKLITTPTHPDPKAEAPILAATRSLATRWHQPPPEALRLIRLGGDLSLCQLALKLALPGLPDIYQGCEIAAHHLTDPDNRRPIDPDSRADPGRAIDAAKSDLTRTLLTFRRRIASEIPITGPVAAHDTPTGTLLSTRTPKGTLWLHLAPGTTAEAGEGPPLWPPNPGQGPVCLRFKES